MNEGIKTIEIMMNKAREAYERKLKELTEEHNREMEVLKHALQFLEKGSELWNLI